VVDVSHKVVVVLQEARIVVEKIVVAATIAAAPVVAKVAVLLPHARISRCRASFRKPRPRQQAHPMTMHQPVRQLGLKVSTAQQVQTADLVAASHSGRTSRAIAPTTAAAVMAAVNKRRVGANYPFPSHLRFSLRCEGK
jgi:hypothetical protein